MEMLDHKDCFLKFSEPNSKLRALRALGKSVMTFSLPAGWTCPSAQDCLAKVGRDGGLVDGMVAQFRCFAASDESQYKETRRQRWHNFDLLKGLDSVAMADLIAGSLETLPSKTNCIRIHVSGDFFNQAYFLAWCTVASRRPDILFYAYTKSLNTWVENRSAVPSNLVLTASYGGRHDDLIAKHGLKSCKVVFSIDAAKGLPIDHDDTHAMDASCQEFALLLHHTQPKGSIAAEALKKLNGLGSYSNKTTVNHDRARQVDLLSA